MHIPLNKAGFYLFVFGGVMVQYNLHYLIKKTSHAGSSHFEWSQKNRRMHLFLIIAGLLCIITGVFSLSLKQLVLLSIAGIVTLLYSLPLLPFRGRKRLKDFGVLKIMVLVVMWTLVTVWLPAGQVVYSHPGFGLIFIGRFIFLFALCLLFDIRDTHIDASESISTIPILMGIKKTYILAYTLIAVFILLAMIYYARVPAAGHFHAMLLSGVSTLIIIKYSKKNAFDMAFLVCVDGMMLLQALLVVIGSI